MPVNYGDGRLGPPSMCREVIEQQRAAKNIARIVKEKVSESIRVKFAADISPSLTRFVVKYGADSNLEGIVELDFVVGDPIDDCEWINEMADWVADLVNKNISTLAIPNHIDYLRVVDDDGLTGYEVGKPF